MNIQGLKINYIQYGNDKGKNVVLLHGWGQNIEMMKPIGDFLKKDFHVTIIDIPGFGKSEEPKRHTTIYDYREMLKEIFQYLKIKNPTLIGHSFGGTLSILYAEKYEVEKLVLLASPFRKTKRKQPLKTKLLKLAKKLPFTKELAELMSSNIGSEDYRNATRAMKDVLVNSVNEDLEPIIQKITSPTLLIWGDKDEAVLVADAKLAVELMPNANLIIFENRTHYAYLEELDRTRTIINQFLKEDVNHD